VSSREHNHAVGLRAAGRPANSGVRPDLSKFRCLPRWQDRAPPRCVPTDLAEPTNRGFQLDPDTTTTACARFPRRGLNRGATGPHVLTRFALSLDFCVELSIANVHRHQRAFHATLPFQVPREFPTTGLLSLEAVRYERVEFADFVDRRRPPVSIRPQTVNQLCMHRCRPHGSHLHGILPGVQLTPEAALRPSLCRDLTKVRRRLGTGPAQLVRDFVERNSHRFMRRGRAHESPKFGYAVKPIAEVGSAARSRRVPQLDVVALARPAAKRIRLGLDWSGSLASGGTKQKPHLSALRPSAEYGARRCLLDHYSTAFRTAPLSLCGALPIAPFSTEDRLVIEPDAA